LSCFGGPITFNAHFATGFAMHVPLDRQPRVQSISFSSWRDRLPNFKSLVWLGWEFNHSLPYWWRVRFVELPVGLREC